LSCFQKILQRRSQSLRNAGHSLKAFTPQQGDGYWHGSTNKEPASGLQCGRQLPYKHYMQQASLARSIRHKADDGSRIEPFWDCMFHIL
jgi:hypothetical protein